MTRILAIIVFVLGLKAECGSQQLGQYTLYLQNPYRLSNAFAGMEGTLDIIGVYRKQWVGLNGGPSQQYLGVSMPLYYLSGGLGFNVKNDIHGAERVTNFSVSYNYIINLSDKTHLSIGLGLGGLQTSLDGAKLITPEGEYIGGLIEHADPGLPVSKIRSTQLTGSVGIYMKSPWTDLGIGIENLNEPVASLFEGGGIEKKYSRHYYFMATRKLNIGSVFVLQPGVLLQSDEVSIQTDISLVLHYNNFIFIGTSLRGYSHESIDAVSMMAGVHLRKNIVFGYAYDWTVSALNEVSSGSHELWIKYFIVTNIGRGKLPKIINNPRFL